MKCLTLQNPRAPQVLLLLILLGAACIRLIALSDNPAGVFHDEAEKGYSAFCLLRAGGTLNFVHVTRDAGTGQIFPAFHRWPLFVDVWGSTTSMVYQYTALPFVALLGLNAWSVRLPAALAGLLTVWLSFHLARRLTGRMDIALWTAALLACAPWHVVFSRWAQQGIFVPMFICLGLLAFLHSEESVGRRPWFPWTLSALFLGLAFYSYSGAQPFLILFLPLLLIIYRLSLRSNPGPAVLALTVLLLCLAPSIHILLAGGGAGMGRFQTLSVLAIDAPFHERLLLIMKNYLAHFTPQFLFFAGDSLERHSLRGFGVMLVIELPLLAAGIFQAISRRNRADLLLLGWFLLFPASAALTNEGIPHALRTLHALPCPQILSAMGAVLVMQWLRERLHRHAAALLPVLWSFNAAAFAVALFLLYPAYSAPYFEYGVREQALLAQKNASLAGSRAIWYVTPGSGIPLIPELFHFHLRTDPHRLMEQGIESGLVRFLPREISAHEIERLLQPGDSLTFSPFLLNEIGIFADRPGHALKIIPRSPVSAEAESLPPHAILLRTP